ncbi:uncharacterized protein Z518_08273 [Rhinocladiella mackenziei CBS 650.93]|uniref:Vacuolar protein-sorting-associated protein 36 n=1 Tax=Rhinocladiella mackenziei CBS 650.93 TaxID=1442369 RepID=A0A0D2FK26_9EURO|nr:uncharacterized protein Z518_08273 [Rhinocladiella mackenziei CBS 650.93]KIX02332.1 hypothetical protein Z518_08273 [Rhinocladiella mackenziei CBS 650.93]
MFLKKPDLTAGSRPTLSQDETLLSVQDGVGLYEGKYKIATCQKGHAYLTSHRVCYVDDSNPRAHSWAIDLKDVEKHEFQVREFRVFVGRIPQVSAKDHIMAQALKAWFWAARRLAVAVIPESHVSILSSFSLYQSIPVIGGFARDAAFGSWNLVPSNFDPTIATESFPLPPCLACGIKPPFSLVLKAAVVANAKRIPEMRPSGVGPESARATVAPEPTRSFDDGTPSEDITCPRCTFHNHPWMRICEMCSAPLPTPSTVQNIVLEDSMVRSESPGPEISGLTLEEEHETPSIKFSFRNGGDRIFYDRLKNAMIQRKWLLPNAPPVPRADNDRSPTPFSSASPTVSSQSRAVSVGIAGLEQRGLQTRKNNEAVLGNAFEDLEALMASAKDIVALAERFAMESGSEIGLAGASSDPLLSQSAAALGMTTTRDLLGDSSNTLYISELARNLAEYATDDGRGILRRQGGTMSLVDLWAMFNRSQNGVELVSPSDFYKAAEAWDRLGLPVKLRRFKSGLLVVQRRNASDEKTINQIKEWLKSLRVPEAEGPPPWDWEAYGFGVTAQQAATKFGWSLGVASEELEMAEERGVLCREESVEGLKFWFNYLLEDEGD